MLCQIPSVGVQTLRNVSAYHEPAWHFDAKFVDGQAHTRANVQKTSRHEHFLDRYHQIENTKKIGIC